ncbi:RlmI/RlmK family 23S rRNA methyltransferase [Lewinellaceae bacterium SD302]|nr:RlmI/RlmK family 23S rRNA methyltransferase [Lewinellaceae bacterium SD302]
MLKSITLAPGRAKSVFRKHPWIFSGGVAKEEAGIKEGDRVLIRNAKEEALGIGHFQNGSIRVRILELGVEELADDFWRDRLQKARDLRETLGLIRTDNTAYRLIHGAGDRLPGLIIDVYNDTAVIQCHSIGMFRERKDIAAALVGVFGGKLKAVYNKSRSSLSKTFATDEALEETLYGEATPEVRIQENDNAFLIDVADGQKTGFFLDQRDNRALVGQYAKGKSVLNTFCYTGGFSVYALAAGATRVTSVDLSATAMEMTERNVALLGESASGRHEAVTGDVLEFLKEHGDQYDIVVVDPPAYAKNRNRRHKAVQAYKRLNARAIRNLKPGGLLFTFSCSQVVDRELFNNTIVAAGLESGRQCSIVHTLSQGGDHPVNLFHPEGGYLKGLVLRVE